MSDSCHDDQIDRDDDAGTEPTYAPGMWRALAMHFVFKQHATQHRADMAALLPVRQRNDDP